VGGRQENKGAYRSLFVGAFVETFCDSARQVSLF
jgi:hypothetical protein